MKNGLPKVSVIVPVYNVEIYLEQCLNSILTQALKEIEIIVLNDGSTDNSLNIITEFAAKDSRIRVFTHSNIGLGPTRNKGIEEAKGEYLAFVDSDDWLDENALKQMYEKAKRTNADIVVGETILFYEDFNEAKVRKSMLNVKDMCFNLKPSNIEEFYREYYFGRLYSHNACDKIYRREMILNYQLHFGDNKLIFAEDNWFQLQVLCKCPTIAFVADICYIYRQRKDSIMHSPKKELVVRHEQMLKDYYDYILRNSDRITEVKVGSLVAADVLPMEALNQLNAGGKWGDFCKSLGSIKRTTMLLRGIRDIIPLKAYQLEPNPKRKFFLIVISALFQLRFYLLAYIVVWIIYHIKRN